MKKRTKREEKLQRQIATAYNELRKPRHYVDPYMVIKQAGLKQTQDNLQTAQNFLHNLCQCDEIISTGSYGFRFGQWIFA